MKILVFTDGGKTWTGPMLQQVFKDQKEIEIEVVEKPQSITAAMEKVHKYSPDLLIMGWWVTFGGVDADDILRRIRNNYPRLVIWVIRHKDSKTSSIQAALVNMVYDFDKLTDSLIKELVYALWGWLAKEGKLQLPEDWQNR